MSTIHRPKVLFVMHLPPPVHGASMMGQYIRESNYINREINGSYINLTTAHTLEDVGKGGPRKLKAYIQKLFTIARAIRKYKPDWVYVTPNSAGKPFYKDFIIVQLCKLLCPHVVLHFHNKGVQTRQDRKLDNLLYRIFFRHVKLILLAESLYEDVRKYVAREDVYICPNGIPSGREDEGPLVRNNKTPHLLWLTNIMITKGVLEYLDALKLLKDRGVEFFADMVGGYTPEISSTAFEEEIHRRGLEDCLEYAGRKYGSEKDAYFRKADLFVLPTYTEGLPLTVLEAMEYALPVVVSNVGGVSAEVEEGQNGFLLGGQTPVMTLDFRPDPVELADKLETLIRDASLRQRMGENGRMRFLQVFSLQAFETRFVHVLKAVDESKNEQIFGGI